jgi:glycosyltransferase involved in cell wall biosynthesis
LARQRGAAVRFAGQTNQPEKFLSQMDIFALSSDTEQMPLGVLEAMAAGLPVVATPVANEGIAATPDTHLWLRNEPRAFADAVITLLRDRAAREQLGAAARRFVEGRWTWEAHFEQQLRVFAEVAARR